MFGEPVVELSLGLFHALETAEAHQMGLAHVGDEAVRRLAYPGQGGDIVGMVRAHLHDGDVRVRADAQDGQGHADVVVQVALGGRDREVGGQDLADEFLGGRLPVRAGQADDRDVQVLPMAGRQLLEGLERIREPEQPGVVPLDIVVHDGVGGAGLEGLRSIGVPVERLPFQGDEKLAGLQGPGVRIHAVRGEEQGV